MDDPCGREHSGTITIVERFRILTAVALSCMALYLVLGSIDDGARDGGIRFSSVRHRFESSGLDARLPQSLRYTEQHVCVYCS